MAKFEITVLRQTAPNLPMVLADRCVIDDEASTADAARAYADLFNSPEIRRGDHTAPLDHPEDPL